jgi:hypothetical protein
METNQNKNDQTDISIKLDLPWTRDEITKMFSWKKYGIDYYTLSTRLYLTVWGNLEGLDKMNNIKNILVSEDHETLLIILSHKNENILPDHFRYLHHYKYEDHFKLQYCLIDEVDLDKNNNHISFNDKIYIKLYIVPDKDVSLSCGRVNYILFANEKIIFRDGEYLIENI